MNVGDYVRTKYGIAKIIGTEAQDLIIKLDKAIMYDHVDYIASCTHDEIIKSSPQIIDLIEVGDYVNGHKVIEVDLDDIDDYGNTFRYIKTEHDYSLNYWVKENEIETIITKEQFDAMQYRVEE